MIHQEVHNKYFLSTMICYHSFMSNIVQKSVYRKVASTSEKNKSTSIKMVVFI